jgi:hypothetical protein
MRWKTIENQGEGWGIVPNVQSTLGGKHPRQLLEDGKAEEFVDRMDQTRRNIATAEQRILLDAARQGRTSPSNVFQPEPEPVPGNTAMNGRAHLRKEEIGLRHALVH